MEHENRELEDKFILRVEDHLRLHQEEPHPEQPPLQKQQQVAKVPSTLPSLVL